MAHKNSHEWLWAQLDRFIQSGDLVEFGDGYCTIYRTTPDGRGRLGHTGRMKDPRGAFLEAMKVVDES